MLGSNLGPVERTLSSADLLKNLDSQERDNPSIAELPPQPTEIGLKSARKIINDMRSDQDN